MAQRRWLASDEWFVAPAMSPGRRTTLAIARGSRPDWAHEHCAGASATEQDGRTPLPEPAVGTPNDLLFVVKERFFPGLGAPGRAVALFGVGVF